MAKTVPVRELRANLSSLLDEVSDRRDHDHVLVTRNGVPAAALVPIDEYEALEETAEILSDPAAKAALEEGLGEIELGETVTLAELRQELGAARPTSDRAWRDSSSRAEPARPPRSGVAPDRCDRECPRPP